MKLQFLFLFLLFSACSSFAQVTRVAADCTGTSSCTTTGNAVGDLEIAYAGINLSATAPSLATGWTSLGTASINGTSTADSAVRMACKVTTGTSEASNAFTNATSLIIMVYRGQAAGTTATCASAILGTPSFFSSTVNTTSTTETFNAITSRNLSSWIVGFGYAPAATAGIGTAPSGMANRDSQGTIMGGHDTNGGVTSFASANVTLTTAGRIITGTVEILPNTGISLLHSTACATTAASTLDCTVPSTGSGHGIKVMAVGGNQTNTVSSVTGGCGGSYTQVPQAYKGNASLSAFVDIWECLSSSAGATTVTLNLTNSNTFDIQMWVYEVSGTSTSSDIDANPVSTTGTSSTAAAPTLVTSGTNDFLASMCYVSGTVTGVSGSGWVLDAVQTGEASAHNLTSAAGSFAVTMTPSQSTWLCDGAAFKPANAAAKCTLTLLGVGNC